MKYHIPFIDKLVHDEKDGGAQAQVGDAWVIAEPMPFQGREGLKERIYGAYKVLKGEARPFRYIRNEEDLKEIRAQIRR
jgi:hypothetical protein